MHNYLQSLLHEFVEHYPEPGQPPQLDLTVGTHDPDRDTSKFRLSDAGRCRLMRFWKREGKEARSTIPPDVLLQMQAGNLLHAYIERAVHVVGRLIDAEGRLEDDHRLGHFDMLVVSPQGKVLYDIKTITNKKAYFMQKHGRSPDPQHAAQLVSYAMLLGGVDALRIAYVVRDTLDIQEVDIALPEHEDGVIDDWAILIAAWVQGAAPEPNPASWECRFCQYKIDCPHAQL